MSSSEETDKWAEGLSTESLIAWSKADEGMFGAEVFLAIEELKRRGVRLDGLTS